MNKYLKLLTRLTDQPLMISESKLMVITENVVIPLLLGNRDSIENLPSMSMARPSMRGEASAPALGVIEVFDSLVSKNASAASGMTSYESLSNRIDSAITAGVETLIFYIDSPGGEAFGLFPLTDKIRNLSSQGISTIAFTDGMMTSAAYAIGAACEKVYAVESSLIGSIACLMTHIDTSLKDKTEGKTYTILRSKSEKALGDSHTPLNEETLTKMRGRLASLDGMFNNDIVLSRKNLTLEKIIALKGSEFLAETALELGLVDKVVSSFDTLLTDLTSPVTLPLTQNKKGTYMSDSTDTTVLMLLSEEKANTARLTAELNTLTVELATIASSTAATAKSEIIALMETADKLRLPASMVIERLKADSSIEVSKAIMSAIAVHTQPKLDSSSEDLSTLAAESDADKTSLLKAAYSAATGIKQLPKA